MRKADIRRVARFHATQADCTPFQGWESVGRFDVQTWRRHFDYDLRRIRGQEDRLPIPDEERLIVDFLSSLGPQP